MVAAVYARKAVEQTGAIAVMDGEMVGTPNNKAYDSVGNCLHADIILSAPSAPCAASAEALRRFSRRGSDAKHGRVDVTLIAEKLRSGDRFCKNGPQLL
jgi:hypothetical protein